MKTYGNLNGHAIGIVLKELVRRAISTIRSERLVFEATQKEGYGGKMNDVFTSADTAAQEIYLRSLRECFPDCGIIAEEDELTIAGDPEFGHFTLDPLDDTKAFVRRQSNGVGTMIAFVVNGVVESAWVGDINTQEIYGYRPDSDKVHRISEYGAAEDLRKVERLFDPGECYILLRDREKDHTAAARDIVNQYKSVLVDNGSIGIWMAKLWKGEVGAVMMVPGYETPWDSSPVIGITKKLGFEFFARYPGMDEWVRFDIAPPTEKWYREYELLVVHPNQVPHLVHAGVL